MIVKIGRYCFVNKEALESLLKTGLVKEYDFSPEAREKHNKDTIFNKDGIKIKATEEEIKEYWNKKLRETKQQKHIKVGKEKVANPWM